MFSYPSDSPWTPPYELVEKVMDTLDRHYSLFLEGKTVTPDPFYVFSFWPDITIERIREKVEQLDRYIADPAQAGYARSNVGNQELEAPRLADMPDEALVALWQELDSLYTEELGTPRKSDSAMEVS